MSPNVIFIALTRDGKALAAHFCAILIGCFEQLVLRRAAMASDCLCSSVRTSQISSIALQVAKPDAPSEALDGTKTLDTPSADGAPFVLDIEKASAGQQKPGKRCKAIIAEPFHGHFDSLTACSAACTRVHLRAARRTWQVLAHIARAPGCCFPRA